ncbi:glycoside hydrolase family 3 N-terminal domain-containing protein [Cutibacterium sp.]|uniref:glycoside hydrolase family 3 N-terminal domain-containing protein n=1 Tax=Cutibacterium sp. TaxID=1912221 RepID=UPI0026DAD0D1|nr:glycoside hydrolase family 3 N-terminal domain-containing protein [Cutibacterium sp.]MDO4413099.1 glycoside hydrolase family 3 N-terminal domain-containing protein [Cutibacterium sp.]
MDPRAADIVADMSVAERAGQCILVGVVPSDSPEYIANLIDANCLAGIFVLGHWTKKSKLATMLNAVNSVSPHGIKPIVATDHEGGDIQNIRIPGVDRLPSQEALAQMSPAKAQSVAKRGAQQLADLGVHMIFSPVADVTDPDLGTKNKPIAKHHRGFGTDPHKCGQYAASVIAGHRKAGIISTTKHFPGIGRIAENTDFKASGITDTKTTWHDPYLQSFRMAFNAGSEAVMIASAYYSEIDPGTLGLFSPKIMTDMLRDDFGYQGLIVSDDLGNSVSVFSVDGGNRARKFVSAGGDLAITADPGLAGPMIRALTSMAESSSGNKRLNDAARHVINVKLAHSLTKQGKRKS